MFINIRKLLHLPVFTESGTKLGHVSDVEIDIVTHNIMRYVVRTSLFNPKHLLIQSSQVKSISADRMIVYDATIAPGLAKGVEPSMPGKE